MMSQGVCWRRWRNRQATSSIARQWELRGNANPISSAAAAQYPNPLSSVLGLTFTFCFLSTQADVYLLIWDSYGTSWRNWPVTTRSTGGLGDERGSYALGSVRHLDRWTFFPCSVVDLVFDIITGFRQRPDSLRLLLLTFPRLIV